MQYLYPCMYKLYQIYNGIIVWMHSKKASIQNLTQSMVKFNLLLKYFMKLH